MTNHYIAFTIGPITRTIGRARKTRELWASSYVFSLLMSKILQQIDQKKGKLLLPAFSKEKEKLSSLGAGIWPDRCILHIEDGKRPDIQKILDNTYKELAKDLGISAKQLRPFLEINTLEADWRASGIENQATLDEKDLIPVHRLNRLLDNLELAAHYEEREDYPFNQLLLDNILALYRIAGHKDSAIFIPMEDGTGRLPSLPEIALMEIRKSTGYGKGYEDIVETHINQKILKIRSGSKRAKDYDGLKANEQLYLDLKEVLPKDAIAFRHKYIAIVVADGDNMGKTITKLSREGDIARNLHLFSENLVDFSRQAVQDISEYGGLPIYAGGDDLLFMAPVTNSHSGLKNILKLCDHLNTDFKEKMGDSTSLSFGVSITYYKYPLGEAVKDAYGLEQKAKSFKVWSAGNNPVTPKAKPKPNAQKEALCFQVRKHSGQQFGATLNLKGNTFNHLMQLLDAETKVDDPFLSSVMYKLQELPVLLADAARSNSLSHFRKHHFNEGGKHDNPFVKEALKLAGLIFEEYGVFLDIDTIDSLKNAAFYKGKEAALIDLHHTNIFYSALRFKQFLIQKDHD